MKLIRLFFFPLFFSIAVLAAGIDDADFGSVPVSEVTSIYDGDTFRCTIQGYPPIIGERIGIRVAGIDCAEMKDSRPQIKQLAQQAKQLSVALLRDAHKIELRHMRRDKYFRIVAEVWIDDTISLSQELLKAGLAKPYDGGHKDGW
jgi:endonuclease YncB( thermonuclease family)